MRWLTLAALLASGCYAPHALVACDIKCTDRCPDDWTCGSDGRCHDDGTDSCPDVVADAPVIPDGPGICYGTNKLLQICFDEAPAGSITLDTIATTACLPSLKYTIIPDQDACVIAAESVTVNAVRAMGPRPLVIVGAASISVLGLLDASNDGPISEAPGAEDCHATLAQRGTQGAGGGGGGYAARGGRGGPNSALGSTGGPAIAGLPTLLTGGCFGGDGADNTGTGGMGGAPGGAVALLAGAAITVAAEGAIDVSGAGGATGVSTGAGGGGGSGGLLVLAATAISTIGPLDANGGGGGSGVCNATGQDGEDGGATLASGGDGMQPSGDGAGGEGSFTSLDGSNGGSSPSCGGGGGGGAAGFILVYGDAAAATITTAHPAPAIFER